LNGIVGIEAVIELHELLARLFARNAWRLVRNAIMDGVPGFVTVEPDGLLQTTALEGGEQL
jgi:RNA polymerase sigma-70 factor (ECF subfamily)